MNPRELIDKSVTHNEFGTGIIKKVDDNNRLVIEFPDKKSKFPYPASFEKYISIDDETLMNEIRLDIEAAKKEKERKTLDIINHRIGNNIYQTASGKAILGDTAYINDDYVHEAALVRSIGEIRLNCELLDFYLASHKDPEYSFALELIRKGTCFLAVRNDGDYHFYPSRFIGYRENSMNRHLNNEGKSGIETNPKIGKILKQGLPKESIELDMIYKNYCRSLGFIANDKGSFGARRKFWLIENF